MADQIVQAGGGPAHEEIDEGDDKGAEETEGEAEADGAGDDGQEEGQDVGTGQPVGEVDERGAGEDVDHHGDEPELGAGLVAVPEQDHYQQVRGRPDDEDDIHEELSPREPDPAEIVEDHQHHEEDPAEDLGDALGYRAAVAVEEFFDRRHPDLAADKCRERAHPCPVHGWQHFNIGPKTSRGGLTAIQRPPSRGHALMSLLCCRKAASCSL